MRVFFFFSSRRRHTRLQGDWSSDVCSSDLWFMVRVLWRVCGDEGWMPAQRAGVEVGAGVVAGSACCGAAEGAGCVAGDGEGEGEGNGEDEGVPVAPVALGASSRPLGAMKLNISTRISATGGVSGPMRRGQGPSGMWLFSLRWRSRGACIRRGELSMAGSFSP